MIFSRHVAFLA